MTFVLTLVLVPLAVVVLAWALQRRLIYIPASHVPPPAALGLLQVERVTFTTADAITLNGWYFPSARRQSITVLVCNGNAGNRAYRAPLASALQARGMSVLLFDYRGFGDNAGSPTETGLAADSRAARSYLLGRPDVDASRLVYFGESLGAAVAIELAGAHPPAALVLRSPFTSLTDVGRTHYPFLPVRWLLQDRFPSIDRIGSLRVPILVIAGDRDGIVPFEQSRRIYEAATGTKKLVVITGADHNDDDLFAGHTMLEAIVQFVGAIERA
jgi:fermentation-respiration switch protein FrsA (DUF1100 family)